MRAKVLSLFSQAPDGRSSYASFDLDTMPMPKVGIDGDPCMIFRRSDLFAIHSTLDQVAGGHTEESLAGYNGNAHAGNPPRVSEIRRVIQWRDKVAKMLGEPTGDARR